jgi:hypothetical protein
MYDHEARMVAVNPCRYLGTTCQQVDAIDPGGVSLDRTEAEAQELEIVACPIGIAVVGALGIPEQGVAVAGKCVIDPSVSEI